MKRGGPLKHKGGRRFKQSEEDRAYYDWFKTERKPCDACGFWPASVAHLEARGSGGRDLNNLVFLCEDRFGASGTPIRGCHTRQEKRTQSFMEELKEEGFPVNLYTKARNHTGRYETQLAEERAF